MPSRAQKRYSDTIGSTLQQTNILYSRYAGSEKREVWRACIPPRARLSPHGAGVARAVWRKEHFRGDFVSPNSSLRKVSSICESNVSYQRKQPPTTAALAICQGLA